MIIGVISDTHGLVRPEAIEALRGSAMIVHAGDIGAPDVLAALRRIAPVFAVRGNNDYAAWAAQLPETDVVHAGRHRLHVLHDVRELRANPGAAGWSAVIHGHTHKPKIEVKAGVLWFNPGSAGPRRFKLPVTAGRLMLTNGGLTPEIISLES